MRVSELTGGAPVVAGGTSAARRAARTWTQRPDVEIQFGDGAAEGVAVHSELACCLTLVAFVLLQNREDETFLEFANGFGIENSTFVHLENQGFQLVFHNASLYHFRVWAIAQWISSSYRRRRGKCARAPFAGGSTHR